MFDLTFDSASLRRIQNLGLFSVLLEPPMEMAVKESIDKLASDAAVYMWQNFKNPTGPLEGSLETAMLDRMAGWIFTVSPYAWRREEGFSGMTDSLGRFFSIDEGIHYMAETLNKDKFWIRDRLGLAVHDTLAMIGG
jgi:hypothetical protein